jgi:hypothetical protein
MMPPQYNHEFDIERDIFIANHQEKLIQMVTEHKKDNKRLEEYDDYWKHLDDEDKHAYNASCMQPYSSHPSQEPWMNGPPSFSYYTEVELPVHLLGKMISSDPRDMKDEQGNDNPNVIYIPQEGHTPSPIVKAFISLVIGNNGYWLKKITQDTGVHFIYYNDSTSGNTPLPWGSFQIWGSTECLVLAEKALKKQINHVLHKLSIMYE